MRKTLALALSVLFSAADGALAQQDAATFGKLILEGYEIKVAMSPVLFLQRKDAAYACVLAGSALIVLSRLGMGSTDPGSSGTVLAAAVSSSTCYKL